MHWTKRAVFSSAAGLVVPVMLAAAATSWPASFAAEPQQPAAQNATARQVVGTIKAVRGNSITLTPDSGADVNVLIQPTLRIVRVAPGQTDLRNAAPIQLSELQVGDRILVRGTPSGEAQSLVATSVIAMKRTDVEAKQEQERRDWQRRGIGGLVSAVDANAGTVTISVTAAGGTRTTTLRATRDTIVRRYAQDSVRFDDAKPSNLGQIKPGDQLRARGTRSADGSEFAAEEIVAGSFRNIAGTINAVDAAANTLTVMDLITRKPVLVSITAQSRVTRLTPQAAQGIAARSRGAGAGASEAGATGAPPASGRRGGGMAGQADLQQVVGRMPPATLADLQKGEAVMIVSTEGTASGGVTAIMLVGGVEPILASPEGAQQTLSPWNLGEGEGGDAGP